MLGSKWFEHSTSCLPGNGDLNIQILSGVIKWIFGRVWKKRYICFVHQDITQILLRSVTKFWFYRVMIALASCYDFYGGLTWVPVGVCNLSESDASDSLKLHTISDTYLQFIE